MVSRKDRAIARAKHDCAEVTTTATTNTSFNTDSGLDRGNRFGGGKTIGDDTQKIKEIPTTATAKEMLALDNRLGGGINGGGRETNINTGNIKKITTAGSSKTIRRDKNELVGGERCGGGTNINTGNITKITTAVSSKKLRVTTMNLLVLGTAAVVVPS